MPATREFLSSAVIADMPFDRKVHDLNANAIRHSKDLSALTGLNNIGIFLTQILPGNEASEFHVHLYEEESYYILGGSGHLLIGDASHRVAAGDFIGFAAGGQAHVLTNDGDVPLTFLLIRQTLDQDVCDYPHRGKRLYMNGHEEAFVDLADVTRVGKTHG